MCEKRYLETKRYLEKFLKPKCFEDFSKVYFEELIFILKIFHSFSALTNSIKVGLSPSKEVRFHLKNSFRS